MAFSDSQTVTVGTTDVVLARTGMTLTEGRFASADQKYGLSIMHSSNKRLRHVAQLKFDDIVANPLASDRSIPVTTHAHIVVDGPLQGLSAVEVRDVAAAVAKWATVANLTKLIAGEN